jgi:zinc/manganese transport system permease protein
MDPSTILHFLAWPIAAVLVIAGIHAYLGLHVVERGVIFVDLSLAQIAVFGATIAVLVPSLGGRPDSPGAYWMSLLFTVLGALAFALVKGHEVHIPQEALIGISYAVASAAVIIGMSRSPGESEHLNDMLVGNILAVQQREVWIMGGIYAVIGLFHYLFRKRFLEVSLDPAAAEARGVKLWFWDFLFYASVGVVVTRSVAVAGVLLVFCYLIVPSVAGMLFAKRIGPRLAIAWTMATVVSGLGMYFSVVFDLPTGAAIVCTFGLVLGILGLAKAVLVKVLKWA